MIERTSVAPTTKGLPRIGFTSSSKLPSPSSSWLNSWSRACSPKGNLSMIDSSALNWLPSTSVSMVITSGAFSGR